jgi:hypothetical protein
MQEEGEKIDFDLLRGWMHIRLRDFMQFIMIVGEYNTLFVYASNPQVLSSSWIYLKCPNLITRIIWWRS